MAGEVADKVLLRTDVMTARRHLSPVDLADAERSILTHLLDLPELRSARTVAAYVSMGSEPGTSLLLTALVARGVRVLVPVLLDDNDLAWAEYRTPEDLVAAGRGLREPRGPVLGVTTVATVDVVLVPGLAVDRAGHRMGRGGGSYDRALARVGPNTLTVLLLHSGEVDRAVPVEPHDRAVDVVVTPKGVRRF